MPKLQSRAAYMFWRTVLILVVLSGIGFAMLGLSVDRRDFTPEQMTAAP